MTHTLHVEAPAGAEGARVTALGTEDIDDDGIADVVAAFAHSGGTLLTWYRVRPEALDAPSFVGTSLMRMGGNEGPLERGRFLAAAAMTDTIEPALSAGRSADARPVREPHEFT